MSKRTLDEILELDDHDGLLDVQPISSNNSTDASRIVHDFEELNRFVDDNGFAPGEGPTSRKLTVKERVLSHRLKCYLEHPEIYRIVKEHDRHNLLPDKPIQAPSALQLDDILDLDDDLLNPSVGDIFTLKHTRPSAANPDRVSERKPCIDFPIFKPLFDACLADLVSGKRKSMKFANEQEINAGEFFILNGVMVYVAEVNDPHIRNGKRNARLRLIFENGTEGDNLLRSLATQLYKDPNGRRISDPNAGPLFDPTKLVKTKEAPHERITGSIYVVRSLSAHPEISRFDGQLFKVGFTTGKVEDRIKAAKDDPTFLMAPVHLIRSFDAINLNTNKLENLMHRFFASARLDIEIMDRFGKPFKPREWFLLPLEVIEEAIKLMLDGTILVYKYDKLTQTIVKIN